MKSQVALVLICMLSSGALSLQCYPCEANPYMGTVTCMDCAVQCASSTTAVDVYILGGLTPLTFTTLLYELSCGAPDQCMNISISLGLVKLTNNTQCCSTNYCNNETLPVLPSQPKNGKTCYVCNENDCSETLYCEGAEDRCITGLVHQSSNAVTMKGCTTKNVCNMTQLSSKGLLITDLKCCQGNMCNSAESFALSFLLMFIPLICSVLI